MPKREKQCLICLYRSRVLEAQQGRTKNRRSFYAKLVLDLESVLVTKAKTYAYAACNLCGKEHREEAKKIFSFLRSVNKDDLQRRRRLVNEATDKLSRARIKLSKLIIENGPELEKVREVENVAHLARILKQRERRLKELNNQ